MENSEAGVMSNRSVSAIPAAAGMGRCSGLGVSALAVLVLTWTGASINVRADTFVLKSGEEIEGTILDATRNTVFIGPSIGGMRQMAIGDIDEVRVDLARGEQLSGQLMSWADGIYELRSGDEVIRIGEGAVLSRETRTQVAERPPQEPPRPAQRSPTGLAAESPRSGAEEPAAMAAGQEAATAAANAPDPGASAAPGANSGAVEAAAAQEAAAAAAEDERETAAAGASEAGAAAAPGANSGAVEAAAAEESAATAAEAEPEAAAADVPVAKGPAAIDAPEQVRSAAVDPSAAAQPAAPDAKDESLTVAVKTSVGPTENGAGGMVFKVELSRPAEQTVVLIYGTLDGTAKAGTDYEPQQGVLTLAPGDESGEIRVPLLEHQPSQGDKQFELFLMADPKVAEVVDKRIVATIDGDD
jgi:Calx-beta domain